jgi:hypothetical protein
VGLERGPLSLVGTIEELFGRKSWSREYGLGIPHADHVAPSISVGIIRSQTQASGVLVFIDIYSHSFIHALFNGTDQTDMKKKTVVGLEWGPLSLWGATWKKKKRLHPLSANFGTKFADKRRSLGRYSSLVDSGHGV